MSLNEFQLIDRYFRRQPARDDVVLGVGDDCALLRIGADQLLAVSMDTLVEDVHFPASTAAADVGHKALAVGLSDLAAMGAEPAWATLSLSVPRIDGAWIQSFTDDFSKLSKIFNVELVGGDTVRGPLVITVQVHGLLPRHQALRRSGARVGDWICVTGELGGAAWALRCLQTATAMNSATLDRLNRPWPRVQAGSALRERATACIDVSDGLLADLGHILQASACGADLAAESIPLDPALTHLNLRAALDFALGGGDDYELLFTLPAASDPDWAQLAAACACRVTPIGRISARAGLRVHDADGNPMALDWRRGHDHFAPAGDHS